MNISCVQKCSGCGACASICAQRAIEICLNDDGFYTSQVNHKRCIDCGLCTKVCMHLASDDERVSFISESKKYKAKLLSEEISSSSSGGIAYALMHYGLKNGYSVLGVRYDPTENIAKFSIADSFKEIEAFRGSKYIQAKTYPEIDISDRKKKYLFIGTPCQVYGYSRVAELQNRRDDFIFVDFFCHGVPSMLVWKKYIKEFTQDRLVEALTFRDKLHGYHKFVITVLMKDGEKKESAERKNNPFYQLFDSGYVMSEGCYDCPLRYTKSAADIRIGDFWDDKNGDYYSRAAICSQAGLDFFEGIKSELSYSEAEFRLSKDKISKHNIEKIRKIVFSSIRANDPLQETLKKLQANVGLADRAKSFMKKVYFTLRRVRNG